MEKTKIAQKNINERNKSADKLPVETPCKLDGNDALNDQRGNLNLKKQT